MSETVPYTIHMEPAFQPLDHIDVAGFADQVTERWFNQTLSQVNEAVVRLGVVEGEYHWHHHEKEDEFFCVLSGHLVIEVDDHEPIDLRPGQAVTIPRGRRHRPLAPERTVMLMIEQAGVEPTGDGSR